MTDHHKYSASNMARIIACPGSVRLIEEINGRYTQSIEDDGGDAARGTRCHEIAADILNGKEGGDWKDLVSIDDYRAIWEYVEFVRGVQNSLSDPQTFIEYRMTDPNIKDHGGTADCIVVGEEENGLTVIHVIDAKFLWGDHATAGNPQLLTYLRLAYLDEDVNELPSMPSLRTTLVQPATNEEPQTVEYSYDEIRDFGERVRNAVLASELDGAAFEVGKHCRYCEARLDCDAFRATCTDAAALDFSEEYEPSDEQLAQWSHLLQLRSVITSVFDELEKRLLAYAEKGASVPNMKVVKSRSRRVWKLSDEEIITRLRSRGYGKKLTCKSTLLSPTQMEKRLKVLGDEKKIEDLIERRANGVKLVTLDKPGEPIQFGSAATDFEPLDEEQ